MRPRRWRTTAHLPQSEEALPVGPHCHQPQQCADSLLYSPPELSPISQGIVAPRRDCKAFWNDSQDKQECCRKESANMIQSDSTRCTSTGEGIWVEGPGLELTLELLSSGFLGSPCVWHPHSPILYQIQKQDVLAIKTLKPFGQFSRFNRHLKLVSPNFLFWQQLLAESEVHPTYKEFQS